MQFTAHRKFLTPALLALVLLIVGGNSARADEVVIGAATEGRFNQVNGFGERALPGFGFLQGEFRGQTINGSLAVDNHNIIIGTTSNLGTFSLSLTPTDINYDGNTFSLTLFFFQPGPILSGNMVFNATVTGSNHTGVFIDFDNSPHAFTFAESATPFDFFLHGPGTFSFSINDLFVPPDSRFNPAFLTGNITDAFQQTYVPPPPPPGTAPEPGTILLLGTGLAGIAVEIRKRRKSGKEKQKI